MNCSTFHQLFRAILPAIVLLGATGASGQWVKESYPLKAGWNGVWLSQDCADRPIDTVIGGNPNIREIWRWNPLGSTVQFTQAPGLPIKPDATWAVWRRGDPLHSTLGTLTGNAAYLINVAPGTAAFTLELTGRPLAPNYNFSSSGMNFFGFPAQAPDSASLRNFENFFSFSSVLKSKPQVFFYNGGPLSEINPKNPLLLSTPRVTPISRGKAYWVRSTSFSDYYGPLKVTVLGSGGIDFGKKVNTVTVRVKNVTDPVKNQTITANLQMAPSAPAPDGSPFLPIGTFVRVRGSMDASLQFTYSDLPSNLTLAPGEEKDLVIAANRALMTSTTQQYLGILQVSDSLNHTRIDLPVSGSGASRAGVWVGAAVLDSVNRVETISGPEFDAPLGTANGKVDGTQSIVTRTSSTTAGQTSTTQSLNVAFSAGNDSVPIEFGEMIPTSYTVTGIGGTPIYNVLDYAIGLSTEATVITGGSGYTTAPTVTIAGGGGTGATATATVSAGVTKVTITAGGGNYTSAPTVVFTGGSGSGAVGIATISGGLVTAVTITNGGSGYSTPPTISFSGGGGSGAAATAEIRGGVGIVAITNAGTGYTLAPTLTLSGGGGGTGATAKVYLDPATNSIQGGRKIQRLISGSIGQTATVTVTGSSTAAAPAGTPNTISPAVSTITSSLSIVTLNGKSRSVTRRVSTGEGAAAPSNFPIRLILHAPPFGPPTLLQQVYLGSSDGISYAGAAEAPVKAQVAGKIGRASSANFPLGESWPGSGNLGGTTSFQVDLGHNAPTNPFVHTYHPDHDNWDARYETPLSNKRESHTVKRSITLDFSSILPTGVSDLTWGVTTLGGTYSEVIEGLRSEQIAVSGSFILHQVSPAPILSE